MSTRLVVPASIAAGVLFAAAVVYAVTSAPGFFPSDECQVKIVNIRFEKKVEASNGSMTENDPDGYRFALVTFQIDKPSGRDLTLAAADVTLHYRRKGTDYDVAPCEAIARFTAGKADDRALSMPATEGPGWVKVKTGPDARGATAVYSDAAFAKVEPDARQFWLSIGQPATPEFTSAGWKP